MLPLFVLLLWGTAAKAQYDPARPPEPGVNFTLTARCVPSDGGYNIRGGGTHAFGTNVDMRISTTTGYRFLGWEDEEGTVISTSADFTYLMPAKNVTLTARFEYAPAYPDEPSTPVFKKVSYIGIEMNPSDAGYLYNGRAGEYEVGTTQSFTARANSNYRFVNWTCEGIELGTSATLEYTVPKGDRILVANFEYDPTRPGEPNTPVFPKRLTLQTNPEGAATLTGGGSHNAGSNISISERSNTYYHFINWTDEDGEVVSETSGFTYTMPDRDVTLTANYTYDYQPPRPGEPGTPNPGGTIAENMVLWPRMGMYDDTHVQILCETPGSTIHYTLDGSTPNAESPVYTQPVFVGSNLLVKAIAYKEGMEDSPVVSYQVTVYKAATPVFTFENLKLNITSATPGAIIRYTTDFTDPTEESEVFTTPFLPEENCRIKAYASKEGLTDSPINVFVFRRADYTIPAPTFTINEDGKLVIIPSVAGGETRYTLDGNDPDAASELYTEPLALDGNFTVKAYTAHTNFYDSPVGEYVIEGYKVAQPAIEYVDLAVAISVETPGASIRYTTDGSEPTEESTLYSEPLNLTEDCKVTARGFKANYEPSDTVSYVFVYADHKVAAPVLSYDHEALTMTMSCATAGAQIRYTTDGSVPTATTGTAYSEPVDVVGNTTFTARAFLDNHIDSDITVYSVNDLKLPTPTASYGGHFLTLSCDDEGAQLRYTLDGSQPTSGSALYTDPLPMTGDCTVRFIATKTGYNDSDEASYTFTLSEWQETAPIVEKDFRNRRIDMECGSAAGIRVAIDGTEQIFSNHDSMEVDEGMSRVDFTAIATDEDRYDSETVTETLVFHLPPTLRYDGYEGYVEAASDDPAPDGAERHMQLGSEEFVDTDNITYLLRGFDTVTAHMESDNAFRSVEESIEIEFYNTGEEAGAIHGYSLRDAFSVWSDRLGEFKYLRLTGQLNGEDLQYAASLPELKTLTISTAEKIDDCDSAFAGSRIETLNTYFLPEGMLLDMPRLTTLIWNTADEPLPSGRLEEAGNPNLLLWVRNLELAPGDAVNVVEYEASSADPADPSVNTDVKGSAGILSLTAGYPFSVHKEIEARKVTLTKEFSLPTEIGECAGWETLTVPFDVDSISHPTSGTIVPFGLWTGREHPAKPFWLYCATDTVDTGWKEATAIEAGTPYIISMPNNEEYVDGYNLAGRVTFHASGVTLTPAGTQPKEAAWLDGITFAGTFMPVEETGIRSLNVNADKGTDLPGSAFVGDDETLPFGAYMRGEEMPQRIPVFGDRNGVRLPTMTERGITVETPAPGTIRISSMRDCKVAIVTPEGATVRTLILKAGESATAEGLTPGLYIAAGVKVMVR